MPAPEKAALRKALRKEKIKARETLTPQERAEKSRSICANILRTPEWKRAKTVMIYKFVKGEVQLKALEEANETLPKAERKTLLYPLCIEDRGMLAIAPGSLILDGIQDPGNLGTILRTADALDVPVVLSDGCADPYSEKTVRASMGAVLRTQPDPRHGA